MTNKLVVIINSLKVPKIEKILLYKMKFIVPNYSCLQNPWIGGCAPRSLFSLSSTEFVEPPSEKNSWVCHCSEPIPVVKQRMSVYTSRIEPVVKKLCTSVYSFFYVTLLVRGFLLQNFFLHLFHVLCRNIGNKQSRSTEWISWVR